MILPIHGWGHSYPTQSKVTAYPKKLGAVLLIAGLYWAFKSPQIPVEAETSTGRHLTPVPQQRPPVLTAPESVRAIRGTEAYNKKVSDVMNSLRPPDTRGLSLEDQTRIVTEITNLLEGAGPNLEDMLTMLGEMKELPPTLKERGVDKFCSGRNPEFMQKIFPSLLNLEWLKPNFRLTLGRRSLSDLKSDQKKNLEFIDQLVFANPKSPIAALLFTQRKVLVVALSEDRIITCRRISDIGKAFPENSLSEAFMSHGFEFGAMDFSEPINVSQIELSTEFLSKNKFYKRFYTDWFQIFRDKNPTSAYEYLIAHADEIPVSLYDDLTASVYDRQIPMDADLRARLRSCRTRIFDLKGPSTVVD